MGLEFSVNRFSLLQHRSECEENVQRADLARRRSGSCQEPFRGCRVFASETVIPCTEDHSATTGSPRLPLRPPHELFLCTEQSSNQILGDITPAIYTEDPNSRTKYLIFMKLRFFDVLNCRPLNILLPHSTVLSARYQRFLLLSSLITC